jgi:hypothetical protein
MDKETVKIALTLSQQSDSAIWQCSSSQGVLCQVVSGPKIDYWNETPILFSWFSSEWLLPASKNKVPLKGRRFQDIEHIQKKCDDGTESYSTTWVPKMFPTVTASLGQVSELLKGILRWPLSASCEYVGMFAIRPIRQVYRHTWQLLTLWLIHTDAKFEVLTAMNIQVIDFWVPTPCCNVVGYQSFWVQCCIHLQSEVIWCLDVDIRKYKCG